MRSKGLYRVIMENEVEINETKDNINGIIGEMSHMVSCVSSVPETFFSILMDLLHQMKYGISFKLYLEIQMK